MQKTLFYAPLLFLAIILVPSVAFAAKPTSSKSGIAKPAASVEYTGYDMSYPQCGKRLPSDHYFAIVGVNGGTAASYNSCLADQLAWASNAKSGFEAHQDKVQLYVNTANPAQDGAYSWASWPTSGETPYGTCFGVKTNNEACSWQYGWNRSADTEAYFVGRAQTAGISTNTKDYIWWLDVETMNSWQTGSSGALARNKAAIEGFAAHYQSKGAAVGLYSTKFQWEQIVGTTMITEGNLVGLPNWRPSGVSLSIAKDNCKALPLTLGGYVSLTQYVQKNIDYNHSCI